MASTLLELGKMPAEEAEDMSNSLREFLRKSISKEYHKTVNPDHFGPIWYIGIIYDPYADTRVLFLQAWREFSKNLFFLMDEFLCGYETSTEYKRIDR